MKPRFKYSWVFKTWVWQTPFWIEVFANMERNSLIVRSVVENR